MSWSSVSSSSGQPGGADAGSSEGGSSVPSNLGKSSEAAGPPGTWLGVWGDEVAEFCASVVGKELGDHLKLVV